MERMLENIRENFRFSAGVIALLWVVYFVSCILPIQHFGIHPRSIFGLIGIPFAPFLHANLTHIIANSFTLFILLSLALTHDRSSALHAVAIIIMAGGFGTWIFGSNANHIGASGVIFGLVGYLLLIGYYQRDLKSLFLSVIVLFSYSGSLLFALIPTPGTSWTGHFFGFVAGAYAARQLKDSP